MTIQDLHLLWPEMVMLIGACVCLFYSFWYGAYKQKFGLGVMFFVFTTCFAYLGSVARLLGIGE